MPSYPVKSNVCASCWFNVRSHATDRQMRRWASDTLFTMFAISVCSRQMERTIFTALLNKASVVGRDFASRFINNSLPSSFRYFVFLGESFDGHPLETGEQVFPEDLDQYGIRIGPLNSFEVVDLLWRDSFVPVWIDVSVVDVDFEHTYFELGCCGRYVCADLRLKYFDSGQGPFGIKSPQCPPRWSEENGRFDIRWFKLQS